MSNQQKGIAGEIPVYCAFDKIVPLEEMRPNPKNPNQHPDNQIELLAKIIKAQGWRAPVTVSTLSGFIVRGHGRLLAAKLIGCPVPVDFQGYKSEADEMADLVADNQIAELSDQDNKMLAEIFADLKIEDYDMSLTGFSEDEYSSIMAALNSGLDEEESQTERKDLSDEVEATYEVIVECDCEADQRRAYETLTREGYICRVLTL